MKSKLYFFFLTIKSIKLKREPSINCDHIIASSVLHQCCLAGRLRGYLPLRGYLVSWLKTIHVRFHIIFLRGLVHRAFGRVFRVFVSLCMRAFQMQGEIQGSWVRRTGGGGPLSVPCPTSSNNSASPGQPLSLSLPDTATQGFQNSQFCNKNRKSGFLQKLS